MQLPIAIACEEEHSTANESTRAAQYTVVVLMITTARMGERKVNCAGVEDFGGYFSGVNNLDFRRR